MPLPDPPYDDEAIIEEATDAAALRSGWAFVGAAVAVSATGAAAGLDWATALLGLLIFYAAVHW